MYNIKETGFYPPREKALEWKKLIENYASKGLKVSLRADTETTGKEFNLRSEFDEDNDTKVLVKESIKFDIDLDKLVQEAKDNSGKTDRIIEFAFVAVFDDENGNTFPLVDNNGEKVVMHYMINPNIDSTIPIEKQITSMPLIPYEVHKTSFGFLMGEEIHPYLNMKLDQPAPSTKVFVDSFLEFIDFDLEEPSMYKNIDMVFHNGDIFDVPFINSEIARLYEDVKLRDYIIVSDSLKIARKMLVSDILKSFHSNQIEAFPQETKDDKDIIVSGISRSVDNIVKLAKLIHEMSLLDDDKVHDNLKEYIVNYKNSEASKIAYKELSELSRDAHGALVDSQLFSDALIIIKSSLYPTKNNSEVSMFINREPSSEDLNENKERMVDTLNFAHIVASEQSLSNGLGNVKSQVELLSNRDDNKSIIIAEYGNTSSVVSLLQSCEKEKIKPVIASKIEVYSKDGSKSGQLILIAKNEKGRQNLNRIISESYKKLENNHPPIEIVELREQLENEKNEDEKLKLIKSIEVKTKANKKVSKNKYGVLDLETLSNYVEGIACVTGGVSGLIENLIYNDEDYKIELKELLNIFREDLYLSVSRNASDNNAVKKEEKIIKAFKSIRDEEGIKLFANNNVKFQKRESFNSFITKKAIIDKELMINPSFFASIEDYPTQYQKTTDEMEYLFQDCIDSLENVSLLVKGIEYNFILGVPKLPDSPIPEGFVGGVSDYLKHLTIEGLDNKWEELISRYVEKMGEKDFSENIITPEYLDTIKPKYLERIEYELSVIDETGYPGYFLIEGGVLDRAKKKGIPIGPGRGSGAGSLVCYCLNITNLDPILYGLLFERFLNPDRIGLPDIDSDLSTSERDEVIKDMQETYGFNETTQIMTTIGMTAKDIVGNLCRVYGLLPNDSKVIKDSIPTQPGIKLIELLEDEESELYKLVSINKIARFILDECLPLEGAIKSKGVHAGGVVISNGPMEQYAAVQINEDTGSSFVQLNMGDAELASLVKFDMLGLKNLDIIKYTEVQIRESKIVENFDINKIPMKDEKTFEVYKTANTFGVFQCESKGMREMMLKLKPDSFEDISALVALYRPGPLESGMTVDFIDRKHGLKDIDYLVPALEKVLKETFGVIVYQEQVMGIARELAGYSLGQADILRKAMGKKNPVVMAEQRKVFAKGTVDTFRENIKNTTKKKLNIEIDIVLNNTGIELIDNVMSSSEWKIESDEQVVSLISKLSDITEDEITSYINKKDIESNKLKIKDEFFKKYNKRFKEESIIKLKELGADKAEEISQRVLIAVSSYIRYNSIFNLMEGFAAYGFNKSHSYAYGLISMQTAFLKAHHPAQFFASIASNDSNIEDLSNTLEEGKRMGINFLSPDINTSVYRFKAIGETKEDKRVMFGLGKIKSLDKVMVKVLLNRDEYGLYKDIHDFTYRMLGYHLLEGKLVSRTSKILTKTLIVNGINAGLLDSLGPNRNENDRPAIKATIDLIIENIELIEKAEKHNKKADISNKAKDASTTSKRKVIERIDTPELFKGFGIPRVDTYKLIPRVDSVDSFYKEFHVTGMYLKKKPLNINFLPNLNEYNKIDLSYLRDYIEDYRIENDRDEGEEFVPVKISGAIKFSEVNTFKDGSHGINLKIDDGYDTVIVKIKTKNIFLEGKEYFALKKLLEVNGLPVCIEGSAISSKIGNGYITVFAKNISVPMDEVKLPYKKDKKIKKSNQINSILDDISSMIDKM